jgi:hypothetical protein
MDLVKTSTFSIFEPKDEKFFSQYDLAVITEGGKNTLVAMPGTKSAILNVRVSDFFHQTLRLLSKGEIQKTETELKNFYYNLLHLKKLKTHSNIDDFLDRLKPILERVGTPVVVIEGKPTVVDKNALKPFIEEGLRQSRDENALVTIRLNHTNYHIKLKELKRSDVLYNTALQDRNATLVLHASRENYKFFATCMEFCLEYIEKGGLDPAKVPKELRIPLMKLAKEYGILILELMCGNHIAKFIDPSEATQKDIQSYVDIYHLTFNPNIGQRIAEWILYQILIECNNPLTTTEDFVNMVLQLKKDLQILKEPFNHLLNILYQLFEKLFLRFDQVRRTFQTELHIHAHASLVRQLYLSLGINTHSSLTCTELKKNVLTQYLSIMAVMDQILTPLTLDLSQFDLSQDMLPVFEKLDKLQFSSVQTLKLNSSVCDAVFEKIMEMHPKLTHVELIGCANLSEHIVVRYLKRYEDLKVLNLTCCPWLSNRGFLEICQEHHGIEHLYIDQASQITKDALFNGLSSLRAVEFLSLNFMLEVDHELIEFILQKFKRLQLLSLRFCSVESSVVAAMIEEHLPSLASLVL